MGWFDYVSDIYSSVSIQSASADISDDMHNASGEFSSSKDQKPGVGTAQQDRGAAVGGGASTRTPASGTDEESDDEAAANKQDLNKMDDGPATKGTVAGTDEAKASAGQVGRDNAGPHGGAVGKADEDDDEEESGGDEEEEEEEEADEPEDPLPKLIEQCERTSACAPLKHHYDECAERVTREQEEHGKASEDCVEEFFHLMHCTQQCAAPKLWKQLR